MLSIRDIDSTCIRGRPISPSSGCSWRSTTRRTWCSRWTTRRTCGWGGQAGGVPAVGVPGDLGGGPQELPVTAPAGARDSRAGGGRTLSGGDGESGVSGLDDGRGPRGAECESAAGGDVWGAGARRAADGGTGGHGTGRQPVAAFDARRGACRGACGSRSERASDPRHFVARKRSARPALRFCDQLSGASQYLFGKLSTSHALLFMIRRCLTAVCRCRARAHLHGCGTCRSTAPEGPGEAAPGLRRSDRGKCVAAVGACQEGVSASNTAPGSRAARRSNVWSTSAPARLAAATIIRSENPAPPRR